MTAVLGDAVPPWEGPGMRRNVSGEWALRFRQIPGGAQGPKSLSLAQFLFMGGRSEVQREGGFPRPEAGCCHLDPSWTAHCPCRKPHEEMGGLPGIGWGPLLQYVRMPTTFWGF